MSAFNFNSDEDEVEWQPAPFDPRYSYLVLDVPVFFTLPGESGEQRRLLPILIIYDGYEFHIPMEAVLWAKSLVKSKPLATLHGMVGAIGRLYAFHLSTGSPILETGADVDLLIDSFLAMRLMPPEEPAKRLFPLWDEIEGNTARSELRSFESFVKSVRRGGATTALSQALKTSNGVFTERVSRNRNDKRFLAHLDNQWSAYQTLEDFSLALTPELKSLARRENVTPADQHCMTGEECDAIIKCTDNWSYRVLFKAMKGLGGRLCEYLNMLRCDVLPAASARLFTDFSPKNPLLLFAHPTRSKWVGKFDQRKNARSKFLRETFGAESRMRHARKRLQSGFKGMVYQHKALVRIPVWIDSILADEVEAALLEMTRLCRTLGTAREHGYAFVGTGHKDSRGHPLLTPNVERAFERAARKAGLAGKPGVSLHGFRHHYVWFCRNELNCIDSEIQFLIGHAALESGSHYGKTIQKAHDAARERELAHAA
ncbi:hypothetical protein OK142_18360 [Agrobacterium sp. BT-220-3]|nr:hypothetical protein [Agrobacterium sp. BT-220-3]